MNEHISYGRALTVSEAVATRRSLRAFLPEPVDRDTFRRILEKAARAPSGTNIQPWRTYVLTGALRERLCDATCAAFDDPGSSHTREYEYYPTEWFEHYLARRREVGWGLYGLLGIQKGDRERTHAQHRRNFRFFDAPVGMMFTLHRNLCTGSWLDYGMYLQNIMLLAREEGLHTCPQAAWAEYHEIVRGLLPLPDEEILVCGMALGYADPDAIENTLVTERAPLSDQVCFLE